MIASIGKTDMMLWVYLYAMIWFITFCYSGTVLIAELSQRLDRCIDAGER